MCFFKVKNLFSEMETCVMINIRKEFDGIGPSSFQLLRVTVYSSQVAMKSLPPAEDFLGIPITLKGGVAYQ